MSTAWQRGEMEDAPPIVTDLALGAFRLVKERLEFELDFTAETLPVLDHYLSTLRDEDEGRPDETVVALITPCAGAYFGEVLRRSLPELRWRLPEEEDEYRDWRVEEHRGRLSLNPIGAALEALFREPFAAWGGHLEIAAGMRDAVNRSLEATGPVREDDFHRLAIRHEVVEQALGVLRG